MASMMLFDSYVYHYRLECWVSKSVCAVRAQRDPRRELQLHLSSVKSVSTL